VKPNPRICEQVLQISAISLWIGLAPVRQDLSDLGAPKQMLLARQQQIEQRVTSRGVRPSEEEVKKTLMKERDIVPILDKNALR
jgi:hypothetical protein